MLRPRADDSVRVAHTCACADALNMGRRGADRPVRRPARAGRGDAALSATDPPFRPCWWLPRLTW